MVKALLSIKNITLTKKNNNIFWKKSINVLDSISFNIYENEIFAVIGESNSGKSVLSKVILNLIKTNKGSVFFNNKDILKLNYSEMFQIRTKLQILFQNPANSLDSRFTVKDLITEVLFVHKIFNKAKDNEYLYQILSVVDLSDDCLNKKINQLTPFEQQKVMLARVIYLNPHFIIADEPIFNINEIQYDEVAGLLLKVKEQFDLTFLITTSNKEFAKKISNRIGILYQGQLIEIINTIDFPEKLLHPYSEMFINGNEISKNINNQSACRFTENCKYKKDICKKQKPIITEIEKGHFLACHHFVKN